MADEPKVEPLGGLEEPIASFLEELEDVAFAYLFGSVVKGTSRSDSDVDVAIQLRDASGPGDEMQPARRVRIAERAQEIEASLQRHLRRPVQVVPLQLASHDLVHNVLRHGRLIVCRDDRLRARLYVDHARRHFDLAFARRIFDRYRRRRIREGTFGGGSGNGS